MGNGGEVRDLTEATKALTEEQEATKKAIVESIMADNERFRRRNALLIVLIAVLIALTSVLVHRSIFTTGPILESLDESQEGIDALVEFVEDIQGERGPQSTSVRTIIDLLCASDDPVRRGACVAIGSLEEEEG